jgi:alginate O-acetyltransferase complex protein AlgI
VLFQGILYCVVFLLCAGILAKVRSRRVRHAVLLLASYGLYLTWEPWVGAILVTSTVLNFLLGQGLRRKPSGAILGLGIFVNLVLLGGFKYLPEVAVHFPVTSLQQFSHLALPLGLSFWTFQAMSYLFDLYRGEDMDPTFFEFALYMAFFPVTISGPICRMPEMLPQFRSEKPTAVDDMRRGFARIATGVFMMQVAKLLGQGIFGGDGITSGFDRLHQWSGADVWCLALGYGLQLFFDFAGYSHIAIGAAQAMGFTVPENFARPFASTNASVFWTRWHMSLSFWIRDYLFLPLATARREMWWRNLALVIAMVVFGLWHKASVLFLLWGCYHGILLVLHRQVQQAQRRFDWDPPAKSWLPISWIATMALINLGWIFFRASSLPQARQMIGAIVSPMNYNSHVLSASLYFLVAAVAIGYAIVLLIADVLTRYSNEVQTSEAKSNQSMFGFMARWRWFWIPPLYALALIFLLLVTLTQGASTAQFMYNKF